MAASARRVTGAFGLAAGLLLVAGLVTAAVTLVGDTLVGGAALDTFGTPDPTVVRALVEASLPAFGALGPAQGGPPAVYLSVYLAQRAQQLRRPIVEERGRVVPWNEFGWLLRHLG